MTEKAFDIDTTRDRFVSDEAFVRCLYCREPLAFEAGRGWIHTGGGNYVSYCVSCDWRGSREETPKFCPECGSRKVLDHHIATPRRS